MRGLKLTLFLLLSALFVGAQGVTLPAGSPVLQDAPNNGLLYGRLNKNWVQTASITQASNTTYVPQGTTAGTVDYTGATDSTTSLQALLDAAPQGTTFMLGIGTPKFNVIIRKNGVILCGPGQAQFTGGITSYWQPANVALPVVQISDDLARYNGSGVMNAMLYTPSGTGQKGLVFAGGAAKCIAVNVFSLGFTTSCIEFRNDDNNPCTFNMASNIAASTNATGGYAFYFYDPHSAFTGTASFATNVMTVTVASTGTVAIGAPVVGAGVPANTYVTAYGTGTGGTGTYTLSTSPGTLTSRAVTLGGAGWTTANQVSNFSATAPNGYPVMVEGAQTNSMSNGYVQTSYSAHGVYFRRRNGWLYSCRMNFGQVDVDNVAGYGNASVVFDDASGGDYYSQSNVGAATPIMGQLNSAAGMFWTKGHNTVNATFAAAATTVTVTSSAGMTAGMGIIIPGAGTSGRNYTDYIASISGNVLTLLNHNSATSVSTGKDFLYGDFVPTIDTNSVLASWTNGPLNIGPSNKLGFNGDAPGLIWHSNVDGNFYGDFKAKPWYIGMTGNSPTVTAITRAATTVTVTTSGAHNLSVGDYFVLRGITDTDGFNTTPNFAPTVATVADTTHFTYTSGVSGAATPAQTPTLSAVKGARFNAGRLDFDNGSSLSNSGIGFKNAAGTFNSVFRADNTTADFYIKTPDTTNGLFQIRYGSSVGGTTSKAVRIGTDSVGDYNYFEGNGNLWFKKAAVPTLDSGGAFIYCDANGLLHVFSASSVDTLLTLEKTITAGGTTGAQTINKSMGSVNFAAAATSLVVTNSLVTTSSVILVTVHGTDATFKTATVTNAAGSFTITANAAATAETRVDFIVYN